MKDKKNCKACCHSWETSINLTMYCKIRISEGGNCSKCTPSEIENGCKRWEKAANVFNSAV